MYLEDDGFSRMMREHLTAFFKFISNLAPSNVERIDHRVRLLLVTFIFELDHFQEAIFTNFHRFLEIDLLVQLRVDNLPKCNIKHILAAVSTNNGATNSTVMPPGEG